MPDHFHILLTPAPDVSLEKSVQFIKGGFSFRMKSMRNIWERSFNATQIATAEKFVNCKRYIEANPVRRGLVTAPEAYSFSSAVREPLDAMPLHFHTADARS